jgi:transcriptional regulator GlxA family with amidase domain
VVRSGAPSTRSVAQIKRVLVILDGHANQHHALNELAALAGLSRYYFSRTFHIVVGVSLRDYLRGLKLKRALELLRTSRRSLTDIAIEAGFYDLPHLDKVFRQRFGTSPYAFRAQQTLRPIKMTRVTSPNTTPTARRRSSTSRRAF